MHDASGAYFGSTNVTGHPNNAFGWAVNGAILINLPSFGATSNVNSQPNVDQFKAQVAYGKGAVGYVTNATNTSTLFGSNNTLGAGWAVDGLYSAANGSNVELTTAWAAMAGYQHLWTPNWRTSVWRLPRAVCRCSAAQADVTFRGGAGWACVPSCAKTSFGSQDVAAFGGTRRQWNPVSQLDVGVDVLYARLDTASAGDAQLARRWLRQPALYTTLRSGTCGPSCSRQRNTTAAVALIGQELN